MHLDQKAVGIPMEVAVKVYNRGTEDAERGEVAVPEGQGPAVEPNPVVAIDFRLHCCKEEVEGGHSWSEWEIALDNREADR